MMDRQELFYLWEGRLRFRMCFKRIIYLVCVTLVLFLLPCIVLADNDAVSTVLAARSINAFALDLYKELATKGGNIFFSPYSISAALTMTYIGARGETATEMKKVLRFVGNEDQIHPAMQMLQNRFDGIPEEQGVIDIANRLWLNAESEYFTDFTSTVVRYYGAGVTSVDFSGGPENARITINDWVAENTRSKIRDLLQQGDIDELTRLVLTNAIYFNSNWLHQFDKANTRDLPFYTGLNQHFTVPMMSRTGNFMYSENTDLQWIKIPYTIPNLSMLILLPSQNETFTQLDVLENMLTPEYFIELINLMVYTQISLSMPRFKDEQRYSLPATLRKLGMRKAFSDADFTGIMNRDDLYITDVIHQAFIEVDEEGTEAAAATAVIMGVRGLIDPEPVKVFNANRPFIYMLFDETTEVILFMGRLERP